MSKGVTEMDAAAKSVGIDRIMADLLTQSNRLVKSWALCVNILKLKDKDQQLAPFARTKFVELGRQIRPLKKPEIAPKLFQ